VSRNQQRAAVLLAVVVFFTSLPAVACFLPATPSRHACCRHMSTQCAAMSMQTTCCQARPADPSSAPALLSSTEQAPVAAGVLLPYHAPAASILTGLHSAPTAEAPPPRLSPGASTSLRI
jgi:hypothetical protein